MKYALIKDYYRPIDAKDESAKTTRDHASEGVATQSAYNTFNEQMRRNPELVQHVLGAMVAGREIDADSSEHRTIVSATNGVLEKAKTQALGFGLDQPIKGGHRAGIESTNDIMWDTPEMRTSRRELREYEKGTPEYAAKKQAHALLALHVLVSMNIAADFVPNDAPETADHYDETEQAMPDPTTDFEPFMPFQELVTA